MESYRLAGQRCACRGAVIEADGEVVCSSCGTVYQQSVVVAPVSRDFAPELHKEGTLGGTIYPGDVKLLKRTVARSAEKIAFNYDNSAGEVQKVIEFLGSRFNMPRPVIDDAINVANRIIRWRRTEGVEHAEWKNQIPYPAIAAYAFYLSAKRHGGIRLRTLFPIMQDKGYRVNGRHFVKLAFIFPFNPPGQVDTCIKLATARMLTEGDLDPTSAAEVSARASALAASTMNGGHAQATIAAGAVYWAAKGLNLSISQLRLAQILGLSEYTVRQCVLEVFRKGSRP